jgi:aspartyl protease family protein
MNKILVICIILSSSIFITSSCSRSGRKHKLKNNSDFIENNNFSRDSNFNSDRKRFGGSVEIKLREQSGVYFLPVNIDGVEIEFILDTGASFISLSRRAVERLVNSNVISENDITGKTSLIDANGDISEAFTVNLRKIQIGRSIQRNVEAAIIDSEDSDCLLGQTWLKRFGKFSIDYERNVLILEP